MLYSEWDTNPEKERKKEKKKEGKYISKRHRSPPEKLPVTKAGTSGAKKINHNSIEF